MKKTIARLVVLVLTGACVSFLNGCASFPWGDKVFQYKPIPVLTTGKIEKTVGLNTLVDALPVEDKAYARKISKFIKGENFGILCGPADGLSSMDIMIREDYSEDIKELLEHFINPK